MITPTEAKIIRSFFTEAGVEVPAVSTEQMIEIDRVAVEKTGPNLLQMMENAGRNLAELALHTLGREWDSATVAVLCGTGGNGGGGICAARHLANRNVDVRLCLAKPERLNPTAGYQYQIFLSTGGREVNGTEMVHLYPDLIIDALIGYNLRAVPDSTFAELIEWANGTEAPILSLDVPSGVDATTGEAPGVFMRPRWTLTLALPKTGLHPRIAGDLWLADLGIPEGVYRQLGLEYTSPFGNRFCVAISPDPVS